MALQIPIGPGDGARPTFLSSQRVLVIAATLTWLLIIGIGLAAVRAYSATPGGKASAPTVWPGGSRIEAPTANRVILFVHPKCPCSRASLSELRQIMSADRSGAAAVVVFHRPPSVGDEWTHTELWEAAGTIPGLRRAIDADGREAALFGAETSGQVLVYDGRGALRYSGGITLARGHEGDNVGRRAVLAALEGATGPVEHLVYGCALVGGADDRRGP